MVCQFDKYDGFEDLAVYISPEHVAIFGKRSKKIRWVKKNVNNLVRLDLIACIA